MRDWFACSLLFWTALLACGEVAPTNPYDPETPVSQQALSGITGRIILPAGFENGDHFDGQTVVVRGGDGDGDFERREPIDDEGRFGFTALPGGVYQLVVDINGFEPVLHVLALERGVTLSLPDVFVRPIDLREQSGRQWIRGSVELMGREQDENGQVMVSITGTPYSTLTTDEGLFELEVPPGTYTLRFRHADYSEQRLPDVVVQSGIDTTLDLLVLTPLTGTVDINLSIEPSWIPQSEKFAYITLVRRQGGFGARNLLINEGMPVPLTGIQAGEYAVSVTRAGFVAETIESFTIDAQTRTVSIDAILRLRTLVDSGISLDSRQLSACELRRGRIDYRNADFSGTVLVGRFGPVDDNACNSACGEQPCEPLDCDYDECGALDFTRSKFANADFTQNGGADFADGLLEAADLFGAAVMGVDFSGARLTQANLFGVRGRGAIFAGANLDQVNFSAADLRDAILGTPLGERRHDDAVFGDADGDGQLEWYPHPWSGMRMSGHTLYATPCEPAADRVWFEPGEGNVPSRQTHLSRTIFSQADLSGSFLAGLDFSEAVLNGVQLTDADLRSTCLRDVTMTLLDLTNAIFDGADLSGVRLAGSIMFNTRFLGTDLRNANLNSSSIELTDFRPLPVLSSRAVCATDQDQLRCVQAGMDTGCACVTRLERSDWSGSLIQGARLDYARIHRSRFNSTIVSESVEPPNIPSAQCVPHSAEVARRFCEMNNECDFFAELTGSTDSSFDCEQFGRVISALRPGARLGDLFSVSDIGCALAIYEDVGQCLDAANEVQVTRYKRCFPEVFSRDEESEGNDEQMPEFACSFDAIRETLSSNNCEETDFADGADCCPPSLIPYACRISETSFSGAVLDGSSMRGMHFNSALMRHTSLRDVEMAGARFFATDATNSVFDRANLSEASIRTSDFRGASFQRASLARVTVADSDISDSNLTGIDLSEATIRRTNLSRTRILPPEGISNVGLYSLSVGDLGDAKLRIEDVDWVRVNIQSSAFRNIDFIGGTFRGATIGASTFERVSFLSPYDSEVPRGGAFPIRSEVRPDVDLSEARFFQTDLKAMVFDRVALDGTSFDSVSIDGMNQNERIFESELFSVFATADRPIEFVDTKIANARFEYAHLPNTRFVNTRISRSMFRNFVNLAGASFDDSTLTGSIVHDVDLSGSDLSGLSLPMEEDCLMSIFSGNNLFDEARFPTDERKKDWSGQGVFPSGLSVDLSGVCACSQHVDNSTFLGGTPFTENDPECDIGPAECVIQRYCPAF